MSFDSCTIHALIDSMQDIMPMRIDKIYQKNRIFQLVLQKNGRRLHIDLGADNAHFRLSEFKIEAPINPSGFCMLLRKYIEGGMLRAIDQPGFDRIVDFTIENRSALGDMKSYHLYLELMGRHSNMMLVDDEGKIIDLAVHASTEVNRFRTLLPGFSYCLPPHSERLNPLTADAPGIQNSLLALTDSSLRPDKQLMQAMAGMSPQLIKRILPDIQDMTANEIIHASETLHTFFGDFKNGSRDYAIFGKENGSYDFTVYGTGNASVISRYNYISVIEMLDDYYLIYAKNSFHNVEKNRLHEIINSHKSKIERKIANMVGEMLSDADIEMLRIKGEMIFSTLHSISEGLEKIIVDNLYDTENHSKITIEMDTRFSAADNAQKYFKAYTKARNARIFYDGLQAELQTELEYIETVQYEIAAADSFEQFEAIRRELTEKGLIKAPQTKKKASKSQPAADFLHFELSDGTVILAGRNNYQNDELSLHSARRHELWFHAKKIPGSHVIVKSEADELNEHVIACAANIAACLSQAALSANVPIDYTKVKNLKKTRGLPPGMVIYSGEKTYHVTPDFAQALLYAANDTTKLRLQRSHS